MHRLAVGSLVVAMVASPLACGESLPEDPIDAPGRDGGSGGSMDGSTSDATLPDGAPLPQTYCSTRSTALLCDDFEQPNRNLGAPPFDPWTQFEAIGGPGLLFGPGNDSPRAFTVKGSLAATGEHARFVRDFDPTGKRWRYRFDVRLVQFPDTTSFPRPLLYAAGFRFSGGRYVTLVLRYADNPPGTIEPHLDDGDPGNLVSFPYVRWPAADSGWIEVRMELDARTTPSLSVTVGDVTAKAAMPEMLGASQVTLGPELKQVAGSVHVSYDDVVVETF